MKTMKNLILYRDFENEQLFYDFTWVMENYQNAIIKKMLRDYSMNASKN